MLDRNKLLDFLQEHHPASRVTIQDLDGVILKTFEASDPEDQKELEPVHILQSLAYCAHELPEMVRVQITPIRKPTGPRKAPKTSQFRIGTRGASGGGPTPEQVLVKMVEFLGSEFRTLLAATNTANAANVENFNKIGTAVAKNMELVSKVTTLLLDERQAENSHRLDRQILESQAAESAERVKLANSALQTIGMIWGSKKKPRSKTVPTPPPSKQKNEPDSAPETAPDLQPSEAPKVPMFNYLTPAQRIEFSDLANELTTVERATLRDALRDTIEIAPETLAVLDSWKDPEAMFGFVCDVAEELESNVPKLLILQPLLGETIVANVLGLAVFYRAATDQKSECDAPDTPTK